MIKNFYKSKQATSVSSMAFSNDLVWEPFDCLTISYGSEFKFYLFILSFNSGDEL